MTFSSVNVESSRSEQKKTKNSRQSNYGEILAGNLKKKTAVSPESKSH